MGKLKQAVTPKHDMEGVVLGRWLVHWDEVLLIMRSVPSHREAPKQTLSLPPKNTARRWTAASWEENPQSSQNLLALWSWTCQYLEQGEINIYYTSDGLFDEGSGGTWKSEVGVQRKKGGADSEEEPWILVERISEAQMRKVYPWKGWVASTPSNRR